MSSPALRRQQQQHHHHQSKQQEQHHQLQQQEEHQYQQQERPQQEPSRPPAALALPRAAFVYTRCYCEENVYLLLAQLQALLPPSSPSSSSTSQLSALLISNKIRACPVWGQRPGAEDEEEEEEEEEDGSPVLWDYHVIALLETDDGAAFIYDLDTRLEPFPCPVSEYVVRAFRPDIPMKEEYRQLFRLVPFLPCFRDGFASDRSHMRKVDGSWNAPPPTYPPISGSSAASSMTLPSFWTMDEEGEGGREGGLGQVLSLTELQARVGGGGQRRGRPASAGVLEREI